MKKLFITTVLATLSCIGAAQATALPATCARVQVTDSSQPHGGGALSGQGYDLALAGGKTNQTFHATDISASGTGMGPQALRDMRILPPSSCSRS